ncbi:MAG: hypothetical protein ABIN01_19530 [Ferruginibacter sp.]
MKLSQKIAMVLAISVATGIVILYLEARRCNTERMLSTISDEGYETAQDILFPDKNIQAKHLRYGPVLPGDL